MHDHSVQDREERAGVEDAEAASLAGMRRAIEALYFAYRDFTRDADEELAHFGFGRAHHRVIYFVGRHPGMTVSDLLALLRITKQSLAPVLAQLVEDGFVLQRADDDDRRRRRLYLSAEAVALERALTEKQARRLRAAFGAAGEGAAEGFVRVLQAMIDREDRPPEGRPPEGGSQEGGSQEGGSQEGR